MAECSLNGLKTLCEKEKLLVTSNFSFSHIVFKRLVLQTRENQGLFGKVLKKKALENTMRKGENAGNQHCLLFSQCFLLLSMRKIIIVATFDLSSANAINFIT